MWGQYTPDNLDLSCDAIWDALDICEGFGFKTAEEKISVLEQVIDYLRMEIADRNESSNQ